MSHTEIDTSSLENLAREMANNHAEWRDWSWYTRPDDAENWTVVYTHNRDSGILDESNAEVIKERLGKEKFENDVFKMECGHWAVGWVAGHCIRVYDEHGNITPAFREYWKIKEELDNYPLLDEEDHSKREYDAAINSIGERSRFVIDNPPGDWEGKVFSWLWNDSEYQRELENTDDQGAYPSDESIKAALRALDLLDEEYWPDQAIKCKICGCLIAPGRYGRLERSAAPRHSPVPDECGFALDCETGGKECLGSGLEGLVVDVEE